jgi:hypothetical protein
VVTEKKQCCICDDPIPRKSVDQLIELGYSHMEFKKETKDCKKSNGSLYFCPKHTLKEKMAVINTVMIGKRPAKRFSDIIE